jgi:ribosomal protein L34E
MVVARRKVLGSLSFKKVHGGALCWKLLQAVEAARSLDINRIVTSHSFVVRPYGLSESSARISGYSMSDGIDTCGTGI